MQEATSALMQAAPAFAAFYEDLRNDCIARMHEGDFEALYVTERSGWLDNGFVTGRDLELARALSNTYAYQWWKASHEFNNWLDRTKRRLAGKLLP